MIGIKFEEIEKSNPNDIYKSFIVQDKLEA